MSTEHIPELSYFYRQK